MWHILGRDDTSGFFVYEQSGKGVQCVLTIELKLYTGASSSVEFLMERLAFADAGWVMWLLSRRLVPIVP